ncbi:hypothetical protein N7508_007681 [Penicillium antarcticum]|uniref:uncharacterized protein n=1 Tax=Penicillium antarcticum TaxID=416450 RepID=UPI0023A4EBC9|nr:uncharacterized protein N7508_007681 [Penicillium antarcticum]KAJ5297432.1 hypothetical protein N7508_007681 [Penicillium antarcticum]
MSWSCLPAEIRVLVLEALLQDDGCSLAGFAIVSREWQMTIELHNFAHINLTLSRLADFGPMIHRNRALVRYIWLCLELQEYDCTQCSPHGLEMMGISSTDNTLITTAFQDLFSMLSTWEPNSNLLLDISVHSPSDSEHWFKYLTFEPDITSDECGQINDHQHGWIAGSQNSTPSKAGIHKVFDEIMGEGPFNSGEEEDQWWQQLPLVPEVTGVLLRQQNCQRWKPTALAQMFARFPRLQEICYEPWREWCDIQQEWTDQSFRSLLNRSLLYAIPFMGGFSGCSSISIPTSDVSYAVAKASLKLECLSASFIVGTSYFFNACDPHWKWPNMTSLTLTSHLLTPDESLIEIDNMLQKAAAVAMKMPNLTSMEIWNGREGLAMLFRYQPIGEGQPAVLTWRGTWQFTLRAPIVQAWEAVALKHCIHKSIIVEEVLDAGVVVKSHGDAIHHLKFLNLVIRPVSLHQIRMEHRIREGVHD